MKVAVFGLGYVGSVSAASFAADGHEVIGKVVRIPIDFSTLRAQYDGICR